MDGNLTTGVIGIIGGGQLGKMIAIAAAKYGIKTHIFANTSDDPACNISQSFTIGDFSNENALKVFAQNVTSIIVESENVPCSAIEIVSEYADFYPGQKALYVAQNRLREKDFIRNLGINTTQYRSIKNYNELIESIKAFNYPIRLKTTEMGYDGKGQYIIHYVQQLNSVPWNNQYILEANIDLLKEISIVIARDKNGRIEFFPIAENHHVDGILDTSCVPVILDKSLVLEVQEIAKEIAHALELVGILAIEFFITKHNELLVNELAPRPHNSCHWSLDACNISQFEQLVRVVCGLPLQEVTLNFPCKTKNIIGSEIYDSYKFLNDKKASLTIYGKKEVRDKRKMGHVNWNTN